MTYSDFYTISEKDTRGALNLIPKLNVDHNKLFRNEIIFEKAIEFVPNYGSKTFDFLNAGFAGLYLVSRKIIDLFNKNKVTGWNNIPVIIRGYEHYEYYLLTITGRCASIEYEKSIPFLKTPYTSTGKSIEAKKGLFFDLKSWDGSDLFNPANSRFTFITENVRNILLENKVTNLLLNNITDFEIF